MGKSVKSSLKCPQCGHEWKAELDAIDYAAAGDVIAVFKHHCEVMSDDPRHPRTWKLTRQLRTHIQCRLQGFTAEQLMEAADKLSRSDWHRGRDPRNNKEFCEPAFLYRSDIQVDKWLNMKELAEPGKPAPRVLGSEAQRLLNEENRRLEAEGEDNGCLTSTT